MSNDRFTQLVARQLSGEASEEESRELEIYLKENPEASGFFELFSSYWTVSPQVKEDDIQSDVHFQQILAIAEKEESQAELKVGVPTENLVQEEAGDQGRLVRMRTFLVAASLVAAAVVGYFLWTKDDHTDESPVMAINEIQTRKGTRSHLLLPDGTQVWLNADSKLEYNGKFNDSVREVTLTGEAYFDVVKDAKRPFLVHTSDIDIRVLGTAFNVKSYPREEAIEATLIHGLIEVTNKKEPTSPKVILHPHEKLIYRKDPGDRGEPSGTAKTAVKPYSINTLPKAIADTSIMETSWIYNKLIFDGETFGEIALKMERWYDVKIRFRNSRLAAIPIHYTLANETIEEALRALQYIEDFSYKINGNEIELY